ncbi:MAG: hypothetical protein KME21_16205 [Desmonostoc vinosum HA7617-LM4]|nr:hypothetical protein [Desmonostoc vinosum HA7617-LM4]
MGTGEEDAGTRGRGDGGMGGRGDTGTWGRGENFFLISQFPITPIRQLYPPGVGAPSSSFPIPMLTISRTSHNASEGKNHPTIY